MAEGAVMERRTAMCRGCESDLTEIEGGYWMDAAGFTACIQAQYGRPPVPHIPIPEGYRGAPR